MLQGAPAPRTCWWKEVTGRRITIGHLYTIYMQDKLIHDRQPSRSGSLRGTLQAGEKPQCLCNEPAAGSGGKLGSSCLLVPSCVMGPVSNAQVSAAVGKCCHTTAACKNFVLREVDNLVFCLKREKEKKKKKEKKGKKIKKEFKRPKPDGRLLRESKKAVAASSSPVTPWGEGAVTCPRHVRSPPNNHLVEEKRNHCCSLFHPQAYVLCEATGDPSVRKLPAQHGPSNAPGQPGQGAGEVLQGHLRLCKF